MVQFMLRSIYMVFQSSPKQKGFIYLWYTHLKRKNFIFTSLKYCVITQAFIFYNEIVLFNVFILGRSSDISQFDLSENLFQFLFSLNSYVYYGQFQILWQIGQLTQMSSLIYKIMLKNNSFGIYTLTVYRIMGILGDIFEISSISSYNKYMNMQDYVKIFKCKTLENLKESLSSAKEIKWR